MNIIQHIAVIANQANETDEQRADRLENIAEQSGVDPTTLYEVERDLRTLGKQQAAENEARVEQATAKLRNFAPMLGMDPTAAEDELSPEVLIKLASMFAVGRPEVTARAVRTLHEAFERRGLYDELGDVETPAPGELEPVIDAEGGPLTDADAEGQ